VIQVNINKVVIKILQGNVVTQTVLGRLTMYTAVANFLYCICPKNMKFWLSVDKVIAIIINSLPCAMDHPVFLHKQIFKYPQDNKIYCSGKEYPRKHPVLFSVSDFAIHLFLMIVL